MFQNAVQTYQTNQVTTASPAELTLMLYNGAIKYIKQAKASLMEKDYPKTNEYCLRVQNILNELMVTLNLEIPISQQFMKMYEYMLQRMVAANVYKDITILSEVEEFFLEFRDTWKEAMMLTKRQA
ncbi:flagellar export chaperone FliS [Brevibacillus thermoruber]|uniref:flagellar export chaperone FliS n=1 Tax=Brevibacillus thermoruber TaxID=33942 RepID=UPI004041B5DF